MRTLNLQGLRLSFELTLLACSVPILAGVVLCALAVFDWAFATQYVASGELQAGLGIAAGACAIAATAAIGVSVTEGN